MIIVNHQELIEIRRLKNQVIEIIQYSADFGCNVSVLIQPINIEKFCYLLLEQVKKDVIK